MRPSLYFVIYSFLIETLNMNSEDLLKTQNVDENNAFIKESGSKRLSDIVISLKKNCYDNDVRWPIFKSSALCLIGIFLSFQLKKLIGDLD